MNHTRSLNRTHFQRLVQETQVHADAGYTGVEIMPMAARTRSSRNLLAARRCRGRSIADHMSILREAWFYNGEQDARRSVVVSLKKCFLRY